MWNRVSKEIGKTRAFLLHMHSQPYYYPYLIQELESATYITKTRLNDFGTSLRSLVYAPETDLRYLPDEFIVTGNSILIYQTLVHNNILSILDSMKSGDIERDFYFINALRKDYHIFLETHFSWANLLRAQQNRILEETDKMDYFKKHDVPKVLSVDKMAKMQPKLDWEHRRMIVDWVVEASVAYNTSEDALYGAIDLVDRILASMPVETFKELHVFGAAALVVSAKLHDQKHPAMSDIANLTRIPGISDQTVIDAEIKILTTLGFELLSTSYLEFLENLIKEQGGRNEDTALIAKYLLETTLYNERFLNVKPRLLTTTIVALAEKMLGRSLTVFILLVALISSLIWK